MDDASVSKLARDVLAAINRPRFEAIRQQNDFDDGPGGTTKYLDIDTWAVVNAKRAVALRLDGAPMRRVLDIGTGCGYFPFTCATVGHDVAAIDHPDRGAIYRDVTELLGIPVTEFDIRPHCGLPEMGRFDVITSYMITFNGHRTSPWGAAAWEYFLDDVIDRLNDGGVLVLELNREPPPMDACYTPEVEDLFRRRGAIVTGHWPHRPERGAHRLVFSRERLAR